MKAHPVGQVVRFSTSENINAPSLRCEPLPTGSAIMLARMSAMLRNTATDWSLAMTLERTDARMPW